MGENQVLHCFSNCLLIAHSLSLSGFLEPKQNCIIWGGGIEIRVPEAFHCVRGEWNV